MKVGDEIFRVDINIIYNQSLFGVVLVVEYLLWIIKY